MSQVDPAVFAELPPDVAAELAAALPPSHESFFSKGNIPPEPRPGSPSHPANSREARAQDGVAKAAKVLGPSALCSTPRHVIELCQ